MLQTSSSTLSNQQPRKSNRQVQYSSTASNGQPTTGLSQDIVDNGQFSDDGKTFTYSWSSQGQGGQVPEVNLEEVMNLLTSRMARQNGDSSSGCKSRCTRNAKYELGRRKRYGINEFSTTSEQT